MNLADLLKKDGLLASEPTVVSWLDDVRKDYAANTALAYADSILDFLRFCHGAGISPPMTELHDVMRYRSDLRNREFRRKSPEVVWFETTGVAKRTMQLREAAMRHYFAYLVANQPGFKNPMPSENRKLPAHVIAGQKREKRSFRRESPPHIPTEKEWNKFLLAARQTSLRNRAMLIFAYDTALRPVELTHVQIKHIQAGQLILPAVFTKNGVERKVDLAPQTLALYDQYLWHRWKLSKAAGLLWLSESPRNRAQPITKDTWYDVVKLIAAHAEVSWIYPYTLRHLRLTDLARAGWSILDIRAFAGHESTLSTEKYIHLSGRETSPNYEAAFHDFYRHRMKQLFDALS